MLSMSNLLKFRPVKFKRHSVYIHALLVALPTQKFITSELVPYEGTISQNLNVKMQHVQQHE